MRRIVGKLPVYGFPPWWKENESSPPQFSQLRMLAWSWLICLIFLPELLVKLVARRSSLATNPRHRTLWRHICAAGGALNIAGEVVCECACAPASLHSLTSCCSTASTPDGSSPLYAGLMIVNLTGFVIGPEGLPSFLSQLASSAVSIPACLAVFFAATQVMFALRGYQNRNDST